MEKESNELQDLDEKKATVAETASSEMDAAVEPELLPLQCPHAETEKGRVTCKLIRVKIPHKQSNACQSILYRLCLIYVKFDKKLELLTASTSPNGRDAQTCQYLSQFESPALDIPQYSCRLTNQHLRIEVASQFCKKAHHVECVFLK